MPARCARGWTSAQGTRARRSTRGLGAARRTAGAVRKAAGKTPASRAGTNRPMWCRDPADTEPQVKVRRRTRLAPSPSHVSVSPDTFTVGRSGTKADPPASRSKFLVCGDLEPSAHDFRAVRWPGILDQSTAIGARFEVSRSGRGPPSENEGQGNVVL